MTFQMVQPWLMASLWHLSQCSICCTPHRPLKADSPTISKIAPIAPCSSVSFLKQTCLILQTRLKLWTTSQSRKPTRNCLIIKSPARWGCQHDLPCPCNTSSPITQYLLTFLPNYVHIMCCIAPCNVLPHSPHCEKPQVRDWPWAATTHIEGGEETNWDVCIYLFLAGLIT